MFDAHCHLQLSAFDTDRIQVLNRAHAAGIAFFCSCAVGPNDWQATLDLSSSDSSVLPGIGIHPLALAGWPEGDDLDVLYRLEAFLTASRKRLALIGECGLDARLSEAIPLPRQIAFLEAQLALAQQHHLPIALHCVHAHDVLLDLLKNHPDTRGLLHAFSGSLEQARSFAAWDFAFSFGGTLTLPSKKRRTLVRGLPAGRILVETDAPDGPAIHTSRSIFSNVSSPSSRQTFSTRLEPSLLPNVIAALATLRGEDVDVWRERSTSNAQTLFELSTNSKKPS